jgi:hypothetical protein
MGITLLAGAQYKLAPPLLRYSSVFFAKEATLQMEFAQPGCEVRFTMNNSVPNQTSDIYKKPITVKSNITVTARAFGKGFEPSEAVQVQFWQAGHAYTANNITIPNNRYASKGKASLNDNKGGFVNHGSGTWLGYDADSVVFDIGIAAGKPAQSLMLHCLQHQGAWIFLPQRIKTYALNSDGTTGSLMANNELAVGKDDKTIVVPLSISLSKAQSAGALRIVIFPVKTLPAWHAGATQHAWFFIDELKLY